MRTIHLTIIALIVQESWGEVWETNIIYQQANTLIVAKMIIQEVQNDLLFLFVCL